MNAEAERIQARLQQIADYEAKGLMPAAEAAAARTALMKRLSLLMVPDRPAPTTPLRVKLGAAAAMLVLVGGVAGYLLSGQAGLRARSELMLAQGRIAAAQNEAMQRERLERMRRGESLAPDRYGRFPTGASAASAAAASAAAAAIAPLLSGRIELDPAYEGRVASDEALFVTVRLPDDPTGLPLAQIRVEVSNLPFDFGIGTRELIGSPERFMQAKAVVVTARISKNGGGGAPRAGDLIGRSAEVAPWSGSVKVMIDKVVPKT
jgi:hypothetical protein